MTKKDFVLLADALKVARATVSGVPSILSMNEILSALSGVQVAEDSGHFRQFR